MSETTVSDTLVKDVRCSFSSNSLKFPRFTPKKLSPPESKAHLNRFGSQAGYMRGLKKKEEFYPQYGNAAYPVEYSKTYMPIYVPIIIHTPIFQVPVEENVNFTGRIKFFDSTQNYGFFILDCDGSDLFVHYEDFLKAGICKEHIQVAKAISTRFSFKKSRLLRQI
eukprot:TRINITY_DN2792_c0_g2_i6.p3 TRINITY_DN2792_c0_g2~~TRINITY_DN2792_c0_g2_i6.p3  ORF type:complete len:166 (+),score=29.99 TRINITY_DN2792_c0_g2_i6:1075-1572(+)